MGFDVSWFSNEGTQDRSPAPERFEHLWDRVLRLLGMTSIPNK